MRTSEKSIKIDDIVSSNEMSTTVSKECLQREISAFETLSSHSLNENQEDDMNRNMFEPYQGVHWAVPFGYKIVLAGFALWSNIAAYYEHMQDWKDVQYFTCQIHY